MNLNSEPKNSPLCQIWALSSNYLENNSSLIVFQPKKWCDTLETKVAMATSDYNGHWQNMQMTVKGVKLKSESFFSISPGILKLWRKTLVGRILPSPQHG